MLLQRHFPMITEAIRTIAAPSIRQLATIGGNVACYIGDSIVALLGYDAEVIWFDGIAEQRSLLMNWLQTGQGAKHDDKRLLLQMVLPFEEMEQETISSDEADKLSSQMKRFGAYHKVGRREGFTPSVATICINGRLTGSGVIQHIRIAVGGGQTVPSRLDKLEKEITGAIVDNQLLQHAYERVLQLYEPREDLFASAEYRKSTAANLIAAELWKAVRDDT